MRIASRYNGPPDSAHGGYTCGVVAELLGGVPARVSLRSPAPLDRELAVIRTNGGLEVRDGERLVLEATRAVLDLEPTDAIAPSRAADASESGYERWTSEHPFPHCFACGPAREPNDGLRLFPGPLGDGRFAAPWTPDPALGDREGRVKPEYVWAALDCPTAAPVADYGGPVAVLAQLHARIERSVTVDAPHAIVSWQLGVDGRKRHAACAIFDRSGRAAALSRALWIELRESP